MPAYELSAPYSPKGDQPTAIKQLVQGVNGGERFQTLLGATGTGKTFTMANVIAQTGRPALVLAHNKTLAAQLCNELREFFPHNAVEYFISYYDYYQPEAYVPVSDTYIAKTASINEEIDMLRHSATRSLFERRDVIVVASISCIYGLGIPSEYLKAAVKFEVGDTLNIRSQLRELVNNQYSRNDTEIARGRFRIKGDVLEIGPAYGESSCSVMTWRRSATWIPSPARSSRASSRSTSTRPSTSLPPRTDWIRRSRRSARSCVTVWMC
jgi:excinuclease ABC subunit B